MNDIIVNEKNLDKAVSIIMTAFDKRCRCSLSAGRFLAILQVDTGRWRAMHPTKDEFLDSLDVVRMLLASMSFVKPMVSYETKEDRAAKFNKLYNCIAGEDIHIDFRFSVSEKITGTTEFNLLGDNLWEVFEPDSDEYVLNTDEVINVLKSIKNDYINLNGFIIDVE